MATKRTRKQAVKAKNPADQARAAWLAGLGAVSIVQKRGGEWLGTLTSEGADLQTRAAKFAQTLRIDARKQVKGVLTPVKANAKAVVKKIGTAARHGIVTILDKLGIPSKAQVEELTARVTALSRKLKAR
jgi:poly(hydroxyalkanoate) granule-associated protein